MSALDRHYLPHSPTHRGISLEQAILQGVGDDTNFLSAFLELISEVDEIHNMIVQGGKQGEYQPQAFSPLMPDFNVVLGFFCPARGRDANPADYTYPETPQPLRRAEQGDCGVMPHQNMTWGKFFQQRLDFETSEFIKKATAQKPTEREQDLHIDALQSIAQHFVVVHTWYHEKYGGPPRFFDPEEYFSYMNVSITLDRIVGGNFHRRGELMRKLKANAYENAANGPPTPVAIEAQEEVQPDTELKEAKVESEIDQGPPVQELTPSGRQLLRVA